jgi:RNA recognition motif-containing protein
MIWHKKRSLLLTSHFKKSQHTKSKSERRMSDVDRTVWVGNLSDKVTEEILFELFLQVIFSLMPIK